MGYNGASNGGQAMGTGQPSAQTTVRRLAPNLHDPALNAVGRVDVLVARMLKRAVESSTDPVLRALYTQFQPVLDGLIHQTAQRYNCAGMLRDLGIAQPVVRTRNQSRAERRESRRRRES